jgi:hypothetical protein
MKSERWRCLARVLFAVLDISTNLCTEYSKPNHHVRRGYNGTHTKASTRRADHWKHADASAFRPCAAADGTFTYLRRSGTGQIALLHNSVNLGRHLGKLSSRMQRGSRFLCVLRPIDVRRSGRGHRTCCAFHEQPTLGEITGYWFDATSCSMAT